MFSYEDVKHTAELNEGAGKPQCEAPESQEV